MDKKKAKPPDVMTENFHPKSIVTYQIQIPLNLISSEFKSDRQMGLTSGHNVHIWV